MLFSLKKEKVSGLRNFIVRNTSISPSRLNRTYEIYQKSPFLSTLFALLKPLKNFSHSPKIRKEKKPPYLPEETRAKQPHLAAAAHKKICDLPDLSPSLNQQTALAG